MHLSAGSFGSSPIGFGCGSREGMGMSQGKRVVRKDKAKEMWC